MREELGLRERKKKLTRQLISDIASGLFLQRGFDAVTVAEIAEAAGVSAKTVFNYFPRKEDLFLDRFPEAAELIEGAVRDRPPGEGPIAALRELFVRLLEEGHPLGGVDPRYEPFWRVVRESPALRARAREQVEALEEALAALLEEAAGAGPGDPRAAGAGPGDPRHRIAAALVAGAYRAAYLTAVARTLAGDPPEEVRRDHIALIRTSLTAVEVAVDAFYADSRAG
ncbi:TetR/AcrR family transcriptional regulator [Microbispora sp. RL4-1S]|uniref:TetR/AcrR family transcriptional regulator n=1 Tax=Microbispora oryzae TaxID=2806554 RepID=A0A940WFI3_9ACTN|nr:TetR/AcrR family transcriptional regulator [Microbispora oryzae]MBP2704585.1 TetR/AcrR family transcriptional regulator [Microbispora oryzae]